MKKIAAALCVLALTNFPNSVYAVPTKSPIVIDAVIATVDEKPITLHDLRNRLTPPRALTLEDAANDSEVRGLLERMILEQAILAEAETRKMVVTDADIEKYLDEVGKRNNLSREALLKVLVEEKKDLASYKQQIKIDILQSRLTSAYMQGSNAISDEEVSNYLRDHPELTIKGGRVKIRRILIDGEKHPADQARGRAEQAKNMLNNGEDFSSVVAKFSDGPESADGGSLGIVAEKELSPELFDAIIALKPGEVSPVIAMNDSYQILQLEERIEDEKEANQQIAEEVKRRLQAQKMESKMQTFFTTELFKHHTVDKKI